MGMGIYQAWHDQPVGFMDFIGTGIAGTEIAATAGFDNHISGNSERTITDGVLLAPGRHQVAP